MSGNSAAAVRQAPDRREAALLIAAMLTIMSNATISPALPGIEAMFPETPNAGLLTRMLVTAPSLLVAFLAPFAGLAADRFGRRRQFLWGVALFAVAGSAGFWLASLEAMLASRLVLGLGVAAVMTAQQALVGDYFAGPARARFMGRQMAAMSFGGFAFIALAGLFAAQSPRLPFLIYALPLLALPFFARALVEPARGGRAEAGPAGADAGSLPRVAAIAAVAGGYFVMFYLVPTQAPFYVETIGLAAPQSAWILGAVTLAGGIASLALGRAQARLGALGAMAAGFVTAAAGFVALPLAAGLVGLIAAGALIGAGGGLVLPGLMAAALDAAPAARRGFAMGLMTTSVFLGQFLSPLAMTPIVEAAGYPAAFRAAALALGLLGAVALAVLGARRRPAAA